MVWASERANDWRGVCARQIQTFQLMLTTAQEVVITTFRPFWMIFQMRYVRTRCLDLLYYFLGLKDEIVIIYSVIFVNLLIIHLEGLVQT